MIHSGWVVSCRCQALAIRKILGVCIDEVALVRFHLISKHVEMSSACILGLEKSRDFPRGFVFPCRSCWVTSPGGSCSSPQLRGCAGRCPSSWHRLSSQTSWQAHQAITRLVFPPLYASSYYASATPVNTCFPILSFDAMRSPQSCRSTHQAQMHRRPRSTHVFPSCHLLQQQGPQIWVRRSAAPRIKLRCIGNAAHLFPSRCKSRVDLWSQSDQECAWNFLAGPSHFLSLHVSPCSDFQVVVSFLASYSKLFESRPATWSRGKTQSTPTTP